ncbi:kelch repeat-containing protein [Maribacter hydrothermalis]|uniref:kelch repeat-containing protein n=1 Tax=Maribacter hydrothermalis TaxID=1836467 RepID=UPI00373FCDD4
MNHTATVFEGKVWVIGGQSSNKLGARTFYGDVWYSNDMKYWYKYDKNNHFLKGYIATKVYCSITNYGYLGDIAQIAQ